MIRERVHVAGVTWYDHSIDLDRVETRIVTKQQLADDYQTILRAVEEAGTACPELHMTRTERHPETGSVSKTIDAASWRAFTHHINTQVAPLESNKLALELILHYAEIPEAA